MKQSPTNSRILNLAWNYSIDPEAFILFYFFNMVEQEYKKKKKKTINEERKWEI